jgi:hypothetical protein
MAARWGALLQVDERIPAFSFGTGSWNITLSVAAGLRVTGSNKDGAGKPQVLHISKSALHKQVSIVMPITDLEVKSLGSLYDFVKRSLRIKDDQAFVVYVGSGSATQSTQHINVAFAKMKRDGEGYALVAVTTAKQMTERLAKDGAGKVHAELATELQKRLDWRSPAPASRAGPVGNGGAGRERTGAVSPASRGAEP